LQEESSSTPSKEAKRLEHFSPTKSYSKGPFPLPRLPLQAKMDNVLEDKVNSGN
jgi:hypothetical protein